MDIPDWFDWDLVKIDWQAIGAIATAVVAAIAVWDRVASFWERLGLGVRWLGETHSERRRAAVILKVMFDYRVGEVRLSEEEGAEFLPRNEGISVQPSDNHGHDRLNLIHPGFVRANLYKYAQAMEHLAHEGYLKRDGENRYKATPKLEDVRRGLFRVRYRRMRWKGRIKKNQIERLREKADIRGVWGELDQPWKKAKYESETMWHFSTAYRTPGAEFHATACYLPPDASEYGIETGDGVRALNNAALMVLPNRPELQAGDTIDFTTHESERHPSGKPPWWFDEGMFLLRVFRPEEWNSLRHPDSHGTGQVSNISGDLCMAWVGHFPAKVVVTDPDEPIEELEWGPVEDFRRDSDEIMQLKEYRDLFRPYREWLSDQEDQRPNRVVRLIHRLRRWRRTS